jgi:predicted regulator of Ras-like GTPase activity (Roadblock/LC7/MglB family)
MSRDANRDESLRKNRLVFYENDVQRLNAEIDTFLELSKARCALLVDRDGHLVTRRGEPVKTSEETISALIAGSFAATREMARLLGENEFAILFHQGTRDSIQLQLIGERTLLATLFDGRTNLGMVRFYAQESAARIQEILDDVSSQDRSPDLGADFGASAEDALDKLL